MSKVYELTIQTVSEWKVRLEADDKAKAIEIAMSRQIAGYTFDHELKEKCIGVEVTDKKPTAVCPVARRRTVMAAAEEQVQEMEMVSMDAVIDAMDSKLKGE